jgi:hypothetical protein
MEKQVRESSLKIYNVIICEYQKIKSPDDQCHLGIYFNYSLRLIMEKQGKDDCVMR